MFDAAFLEEISSTFDLVAYARQHLSGEIQEEPDGEVRITDHGGLLINPTERVWYTHRDQIGGDCFDLIAWVRYHTLARNLGKRFRGVVIEAAAFAGTAMPIATAQVEQSSTGEGGSPPSPDSAPNNPDDPRPRIDVSHHDIPIIAEQFWMELLKQGVPFYRRDGRLIALIRDEAGAFQMILLDVHRLIGWIARAVICYQVSRRGQHAMIVEPPPAVMYDMLIQIHPGVPILNSLVRAPVYTRDGTLILTPGYHPDSGVYYDPAPGLVVPDVPLVPEPADLIRAREIFLKDLLGDFSFASDADRTHALELLLLPFVRPMIDGPTPLHLIESPTPGSGKGLLADVLLRPAFKTPPAAMAEANSDEEWRKRLTSALLEGADVVMIDNVNRMLASGALASVLTAESWKDRVLGRSEMVQASIHCLWVATANNPTLSYEMVRRCISIRLNPRVERPWERTEDVFRHPDLRLWAIAHRNELIWAALVLIRYGLHYGRPTRSLGSFEHWSACLGRILDGIGMPDFLGTSTRLLDQADAEDLPWRALVVAWWYTHRTKPVTTRDLLQVTMDEDIDLPIVGTSERAQRTALGIGLMKLCDRVIKVDAEGLHVSVCSPGLRQGARLFQLEPLFPQHDTNTKGSVHVPSTP